MSLCSASDVAESCKFANKVGVDVWDKRWTHAMKKTVSVYQEQASNEESTSQFPMCCSKATHFSIFWKFGIKSSLMTPFDVNLRCPAKTWTHQKKQKSLEMCLQPVKAGYHIYIRANVFALQTSQESLSRAINQNDTNSQRRGQQRQETKGLEKGGEHKVQSVCNSSMSN